jgi:hypothetical protein
MAMHRTALFVFILAAGPALPAFAQEATTFDQLQDIVKPGDAVTVTETSGRTIRGMVGDVSSTTLHLLADGKLRQLTAADVDVIRRRGRDSLLNGALVGYGIAAGVLLPPSIGIGKHYHALEHTVPFALLLSGIGAGIGAGVDAMILGDRVIYAAPGASTAKVGVRPVLTGGATGVAVSLTF